MAMMETPMIAIIGHLQMRGLIDEGTRPTLIVRICSQYDNTDWSSEGNRANNRDSEEEKFCCLWYEGALQLAGCRGFLVGLLVGL